MSLALILVSVYALIVTVVVIVSAKFMLSKPITTFDYNNIIQKKTCLLYFDMNGYLMSNRDISNNAHVLSSLQPGDHISQYKQIPDLITCLKMCIKHHGNVTYKVEENAANGIVKRIDLIFTPLICNGYTNGVMVISQEMYSKNRESELLDKARVWAQKNDDLNKEVDKLDTERKELEDAFRKSSKHHIKLQKAMYQVEQQKKELEEALDTINKQKEELEIVNAEIRKSNKMKETFLANTSHEIRTPLNAIIGFTNLLMKNDPATSQIPYLVNIKNAGNSLSMIINDILDLSKIEAGKMDLEWTNLDIRDTIRKCVNTVSFKRDGKSIDISMSVDDAIPSIVVGDPVRITQIFTNLLNNSIKFTGENCIIKIAARLLGKNSDDVEIEFRVSDNGIGIPKEKQSDIFKSFTQANADTTRKYGGTGLGLSITKQLVEMYGGHIRIDSESGQGATFIFNLIMKDAGPLAEIADVIVDRNSNSIDRIINVLLVEDNEINRQLAVDTLLAWNKNIIIDTAENGQMAVDKANMSKYDIILMDIQMPVMDGNTAAHTIRNSDSPNRDVPIIAMTAHAFKEERDRCLSNGMNDYVMKPFDPEDLCNKICKYTARKDDASSDKKDSSDAENSELFNLKGLLDTCGSDFDELQKIIDVYATAVPADIDGLVEAFHNNDATQMKMKHHSLKTAFAYLGTSSLAEMLEGLIQLMNEPDASISIPVEKINDEWSRIFPMIQSYVKNLRRQNRS